MRIHILPGLAALLTACGLLLAPAPASAADEALLAALRGGGLTIYFRHEATDWTQADRVVEAGDWLSCDGARIRQLSAAGRQSAKATGAAMRALGIPVARVLASPYCRTMETARLLGYGDPEASTAVVNLRVADFHGGRDAVIASARQLLAKPVPAGANTLVIAHGNVARAATPVYPAEGEAVAFRADGRGGFDLVGRMPPAAWRALAEELDQAQQKDTD